MRPDVLENIATNTESMTGGEAIARMVRALGAGPMFGMGGFQLLPFYDAARRMGLNHHLVNDERAAVFIADAYAKVSGCVGIVDATLGPGATNLVTGLVEALNAGTPLIAIVGDAHRDYAGKNMTQETRQIEILRPAVKDILRIESVQRIPELVRRAFALATSGRPGPVAIDVPEDIAHATHEFALDSFTAAGVSATVPALRCRAEAGALSKAAALLVKAARPIILAGGGVHISGATEVLTAFARASGIPVAHTLTGKGAIPCTDPLSAGLFGRYDRIANDLIERADVILVVGCKLGEIATKRYVLPPPGATVIHLDSSAEEFDRTLNPTLRLWSDVREGVSDLQAALAGEVDAMRQRLAPYGKEVVSAMAAWRVTASERLESKETPINMGRVLGELNKILPEDAILVADGGFAAHWGGLLYDTKQAGRGFVPDRGFASIGYGLPGAMGVALAAPGRTVVSLTGDGGFNMMLGELETARRLGVDFILIVVNNAASGYIKALQHLMYGSGAYHASDLIETNYGVVAQAFGCTGIRVEDPEELSTALSQAMQTTGPVILDVVVTRDPAHMLPAADSRAVTIKKGDRIA